MIFPYTDDGRGRFLDTGSDRLLIMRDLAEDLGIDVNSLPTEVILRAATGQDLNFKLTTLCVQLVKDGVEVTWLAEVAVALGGIRINHWGFQGFLEYFSADFNGPKRLVTLIPGDNLPVTTPPS